MQVTLATSTAAEARLLAAFLNDLADLMDAGLPAVITAPTPPVDVALPVPEATAKKTRSRKSATTAETPVESTSEETAKAADEGNESALVATEPAASSEEPAGATETPPDSPSASAAKEPEVSLDDLRVLFGTLTQVGKRGEAVAVVRKYGANGLAEIPEDKRAAVHAELKAL